MVCDLPPVNCAVAGDCPIVKLLDDKPSKLVLTVCACARVAPDAKATIEMASRNGKPKSLIKYSKR